MPRYSQGAIVIQQESPWSQFLEGIGKGVSMAIQNKRKKYDEAESNVDAMKMAILQNKLPASVTASQQFIDYTKKYGLYDHPDIQAMIAQARAELPVEMTEAPVQEGQETIPIAGALPPGAEAGPESDMARVGPALAQRPREQITPTATDIWKHVERKEEVRKLAYEEQVGKQRQFRAQEQYAWQKDYDLDNTPSIPTQIQRAYGMADSVGIPRSDLTFTLSATGRVTTSFKTADADELVAREDKKNQKLVDFEKTAATYLSSITLNRYRLAAILDKDKVSLEDLAIGKDEDPTVANIMRAAALAIGAKTTPAERVKAALDESRKALEFINKNIRAYNRVIESVGDKAGLESDLVMSRFLKELTFEDISGGLSEKEYRAKKGPAPSGEKLISELRKDYQLTGVQPGLPGSRSSSSDSDKVKKAYDGVAGVVKEAMAGNKGLTKDSIRSNIMEMKNEIMAEYGLNERGFSLLLSMADRVMA